MKNNLFSADEEEEKEELNELYKEAKMPLEEIILKYKNKLLEKFYPGESEEDETSSLSIGIFNNNHF